MTKMMKTTTRAERGKRRARQQLPSVQNMSVQDERRALAEIRKQFNKEGKVPSQYFSLESTQQEAGKFALAFVLVQHLKRKQKKHVLVADAYTGEIQN